MAWLKDHYPTLESVSLVGNKKGLRCNICYNNLSEARRASRNGHVPIAQGMRCDEAKAVKSIIDHLIGVVVSAPVAPDNAEKHWNSLYERMTALMTDILRQFEKLRKEARRRLIPFPDLLASASRCWLI